MKNEHAELEQRVSQLAVEIAKLRRLVIICFGIMGAILAAGFIDRDLPLIVASIGAVIWAFGYVCDTVGNSLRRFSDRRRHHVD